MEREEEEKEGEGVLGMHKMKGLVRISPKMRLPRPLVQQFMSNFYEEEASSVKSNLITTQKNMCVPVSFGADCHWSRPP
jgi:hypothetical protein